MENYETNFNNRSKISRVLLYRNVCHSNIPHSDLYDPHFAVEDVTKTRKKLNLMQTIFLFEYESDA